MPFAIQFEDETFLRRPVNKNGSDRARERVEDINDATTWTQAGHAKTALTAAVENGDIGAHETVEILEIIYAIKKSVGKFTTELKGSKRSVVAA